jgi:hypothetical protein
LKQLENTSISDDLNKKNSSDKIELNTQNTQEIKIMSNNYLKFESEFFDENSSNIKDDEVLILNKNKPYLGYDHSKETNRILVVTHGGFIMELMNVIRNKKGLEMKTKNSSYNTAVYMIKIYCSVCGGICNKCGENKLEYDFIIFNDNSHCADLK